MIFCIKYATRGRPEWFKKTIQNIRDTISNDAEYFIIVSADIDDATMNNLDIQYYVDWVSKSGINIVLKYGTSKTKIEAINADLDNAPNWDILINMSDDMKFVVKDWNKVIETDVKKVFPEGDFFAHYNDGFVKDALATMTIIDRKYYNRDGYIYHPSYKSFSCDAEAYYVAILRGRHYYFDKILFLHQHPNNTPYPKDKTYQINSLHTPHDTANYFKRLNDNFGEIVTGPTPFDKWKNRHA